jgi:hypothetical protein
MFTTATRQTMTRINNRPDLIRIAFVAFAAVAVWFRVWEPKGLLTRLAEVSERSTCRRTQLTAIAATCERRC